MNNFNTEALLSDDEMNEDSKWNIQNGDQITKGVSTALDTAYAALAAAAGIIP